LKAGPDITRPAVVVLGAEADLDQLNTLLTSGADAVLTEPLDLEALYEVLDRFAVDER
jgi:CheY-like chemotaxis protein